MRKETVLSQLERESGIFFRYDSREDTGERNGRAASSSQKMCLSDGIHQICIQAISWPRYSRLPNL
jgi:hypothetical protein